MRKALRAQKRIERDKQTKYEKLIKDKETYNYDDVFRYYHFIDKLPRCMEDVMTI